MKSIFRYENKPTNNFLGTDGSSDAITLFDTGMIRYEHYLFRCDTPSEIREVGPFSGSCNGGGKNNCAICL